MRSTTRLVLLTADHETGGFGFTYSAADIPAAKKLEGTDFKGPYQAAFNFGDPAVLNRL